MSVISIERCHAVLRRRGVRAKEETAFAVAGIEHWTTHQGQLYVTSTVLCALSVTATNGNETRHCCRGTGLQAL